MAALTPRDKGEIIGTFIGTWLKAGAYLLIIAACTKYLWL